MVPIKKIVLILDLPSFTTQLQLRRMVTWLALWWTLYFVEILELRASMTRKNLAVFHKNTSIIVEWPYQLPVHIFVTYLCAWVMFSLNPPVANAYKHVCCENIFLLLSLRNDTKKHVLICSYISPHWDTVTGILGLLFGPVGTFSIFLTTSKPSRTLPNTTCLPSRKSHLEQVMKNWEPFVSRPLFAYLKWYFTHIQSIN